MSLTGKTLFITGGSRGIGLEIALAAAAQGANIVIAARSDKPQPKLPGTIHTAAEQIEKAGGKCLPLVMDVRDEERVAACAAQAAEHFGGIDILVNNASAIYLAGSLDVPAKRFDLMQQVNMRGTFMTSQACLPFLLKAENPHILTLSPPIDLQPQWFARHTAYTISKYSMSMVVFGLAAEFGPKGVAVNALWPQTVIDTAALAMLKGFVERNNCRKARIVADAALAIFKRKAADCTGNFFIDEAVLREEGMSDFAPYAVCPGQPLQTDLFLTPA